MNTIKELLDGVEVEWKPLSLGQEKLIANATKPGTKNANAHCSQVMLIFEFVASAMRLTMSGFGSQVTGLPYQAFPSPIYHEKSSFLVVL